jgi:hypothetical protein
MPSRPDASREPGGAPAPGRPDAELKIAEAEARYARDRLALYRARVLTGKPTSHGRLRELTRVSAAAEGRLRRAQGR